MDYVNFKYTTSKSSLLKKYIQSSERYPDRGYLLSGSSKWDNTPYVLSGSYKTPDIKFNDLTFIEDTREILFRGKFYKCMNPDEYLIDCLRTVTESLKMPLIDGTPESYSYVGFKIFTLPIGKNGNYIYPNQNTFNVTLKISEEIAYTYLPYGGEIEFNFTIYVDKYAEDPLSFKVYPELTYYSMIPVYGLDSSILYLSGDPNIVLSEVSGISKLYYNYDGGSMIVYIPNFIFPGTPIGNSISNNYINIEVTCIYPPDKIQGYNTNSILNYYSEIPYRPFNPKANIGYNKNSITYNTINNGTDYIEFLAINYSRDGVFPLQEIFITVDDYENNITDTWHIGIMMPNSEWVENRLFLMYDLNPKISNGNIHTLSYCNSVSNLTSNLQTAYLGTIQLVRSGKYESGKCVFTCYCKGDNILLKTPRHFSTYIKGTNYENLS